MGFAHIFRLSSRRDRRGFLGCLKAALLLSAFLPTNHALASVDIWLAYPYSDGSNPRWSFQYGSTPEEAVRRHIEIILQRWYPGSAYDFSDIIWLSPNEGVAHWQDRPNPAHPDWHNISHAVAIILRVGSCSDGMRPNATTGACEPDSTATSSKMLGNRCEGIGNPCNPATGNKYQKEEDYRNSDGSLILARHYNSLLATDAGLGFGWTSIFHRRLEINGSTIRVRQADGRAEPFQNSSGQWRGDADSKISLTQNSSGYALASPDGAVERYDSAGRLSSATDRNGKTTTYTYDSNGKLRTVVGPFGHTLTFGHDTNGRLVSVTDPAGGVIRYSYDTHGNLTQVTYADGSSRSYHYENTSFPHHLTGITDETGARFATYAYDGTGKAIATEHAGGQERFTLRYDSATQTTVTDAAGTQEVLTFQETLGVKNLLGRMNQADGKGVSQTFDAQNNLLSRTDELGRTTSYAYTATNQRAAMTEAAGTPEARTTTYGYLATGLELPVETLSPSVAPGRQKLTRIEYSGNNPVRITQSGYTPAGEPVARTVAMEYNTRGQLTRIDGPRSDVADVTSFEYYDCTSGSACGQLRRTVNALGQATSFDSYDAHGRVTQMTDANGLATAYTYDARGRMVSITQTPPGGSPRTTRYAYDPAGNLASVEHPQGLRVSYSYDAAHKLRTVTDNEGNRIEYGYDLKGNRTVEKTYDPSGALLRSIETTYDLRNRAIQVNDGGSLTQQVRDAVGNLTAQTDPKANPPTAHSYDPLNRLLETIDALGGRTGYAYDTNGRASEVRVPNGARTGLVYDDLGNLIEERSPDRGATRYTHDATGNLATQTDARGVTVAYQYDALNRVTRIDYPGSDEDVTLTYDAGPNCTFGLGRLCAVTDQSGTTVYGYDAFGNPTETRHAELGLSYTTRAVYDESNRAISLTYPDGRRIEYTRNARGDVTEVRATVNGIQTTLVSGISTRFDGLIRTQIYGNGLTEARIYDPVGRLVTQTLGGAGVIAYQYDANGNLTARTDSKGAKAFGYDALDRLTRENSTASLAWDYDGNGNRLSETQGAEAKTYGYTPETNRLTQVSKKTVTLDASGNTLTDQGGKRRYAYNQAARLAGFYEEKKLKASYTYDYRGLRTRKVKDPEKPHKATLYHYDQGGRLLTETDERGYPQRAYIYLESIPVAQIEFGKHPGNDRVYYLHTDALGTPRLASDSAQRIAWRDNTNAFGDKIEDEGKDADKKSKDAKAKESKEPKETEDDENEIKVNLRFAGQYYDKETGLHYNWNRYYDPKVGRYISSDPIGLAGGLNAYLYAKADPLRYTDSLGLFAGDGHSILTQDALSGDACFDTNDLAMRTQNVDYVSGSQSPANAHWHAMRDGTSGESAIDAERRYDNYVEEQIRSCSVDGLARALHAVQDSAARGHKGFQSWSGGVPSGSHTQSDFFPSANEWQEALQKSRDVVQRIKERCSCICKK